MTGRKSNAPSWLTERPFAHRGLHSKKLARIENTLAAAAAAIAHGYAIECDVQVTGDGEAVVFHDFTLDRLTHITGRVDAFDSRELTGTSYQECDERITRLADFLTAIKGRVPLIIEIKSRLEGDMRLAGQVLRAVSDYRGPVCLKSFDPAVLIYLRAKGAACPLGLVAQANYNDEEWIALAESQRAGSADLGNLQAAQPDFLSWNVSDLPHAIPALCRADLGMPVLTWTVRSAGEAARARLWADQIIFEGFEP